MFFLIMDLFCGSLTLFVFGGQMLQAAYQWDMHVFF